MIKQVITMLLLGVSTTVFSQTKVQTSGGNGQSTISMSNGHPDYSFVADFNSGQVSIIRAQIVKALGKPTGIHKDIDLWQSGIDYSCTLTSRRLVINLNTDSADSQVAKIIKHLGDEITMLLAPGVTVSSAD